MSITFNKLKSDSKIFEELKKNPAWWTKFKNDKSIYIEIRKDNQINVYFEGGSVVRIHYCSKHKKLQVFTHHKYLNLPAPSKSNAYIECSDFIDKPVKDNDEILVCDTIIERIRTRYSQKLSINNKEKWSEKFIQGLLIVQSSAFHLDSEFAYNDDISQNRIDLVRCDNGVVTFVELKRRNDGRMLHKTDESPEIVEQMLRYRNFILRYSNELLAYYQKLYDIKVGLQLPVPKSRPTSINPEPHLLVFDTWEKNTPGRDTHRNRLQEILQREKIEYSIKTDL